jgi:tetratricopeptide (TPR) repeat protein
MSLLLDARKKSQGPHDGQDSQPSHPATELSLEEHPHKAASASVDAAQAEIARSAGQNLFSAKTPAQSQGRAGINQNLLILLIATVTLFAAGSGYLWYLDAASNSQPLRPAYRAPAPVQVAQPAAATVEAPPQDKLVPGLLPSEAATGTQPDRTEARNTAPRPRKTSTIKIRPQHAGPIDALLGEAYLNYRNGKFEQAQQLYRAALSQDAQNTDALLGLAVIAQHQGANDEAAHFYARVLALDPRNALANAGMSGLSNDDNRESRLKTLLYEQPDAPSLHFALGNHYAALARWSDAQQAYFNAYKHDPNNAELAFNLAISLDRLGQKKLAAQYYQRALQLDSHNSAGFDHAATSLRAQALAR